MDVNYESNNNQNNVKNLWHKPCNSSPWKAEAGRLLCWVYPRLQTTETKREREEEREAKHSLYFVTWRSQPLLFPPSLLCVPPPPPLFPVSSPSPSCLPFLSLHVNNSTQFPWVRASKLWILARAPFILKISNSKLWWRLLRILWIIWEQCSTNRNLSLCVTCYIVIWNRTESHHTWHCYIIVLENNSPSPLTPIHKLLQDFKCMESVPKYTQCTTPTYSHDSSFWHILLISVSHHCDLLSHQESRWG